MTLGPGLVGSLLIGLAFAKGLAMAHELPLIAVDTHRRPCRGPFHQPQAHRLPAACSCWGGHTSLFYHEEKFSSRVVAKTRDDAAGEVMDKVAKHFGLGYPGPLLDALYAKGDPGRLPFFTRPRMSDGGDDFSFSGYKSALLRQAQDLNARGARIFMTCCRPS